MRITQEEFKKLAESINAVYPHARVRLGAPPVATKNTDKIRCLRCRKHAWDCRCGLREELRASATP